MNEHISDQAIHGYHGQYLRIDVTTGYSEAVPLSQAVLRQFLGGSGLGTYLLLQHGAAELDPMAPQAPLVFVFSPLVGSPLTTSAKFAVASKSPLTGRINDSLVSSRFAILGKRTGYDALMLVGRASSLVVVVVDGGQVRLEPATQLQGTTSKDAEQRIHDRLGSDFAVAVIGPAGENQVRYATTSHDGRHAGRGGSGAVLGSKNVKAIAVRGTKRSTWANPPALVDLSRELSERSFGPATAKYRELGTASNLLLFNRLGTLPTRNFQQGSFEGAFDISPEQLAATRQKARQSCAACTIGCEHLYSLAGSEGPKVRLEYENLFALGPLCGVSDSQTVLLASRRCDEVGLDTISTGGTIAFAMECVARGLLDAPWLQFGDGKALLRAIDLIASREGLGDLLAEGSRRFAQHVGENSIAFAPQVKGLEIPGYEPRALQTMALGFAVATRGADHNRSGAYEVDFSERIDRRNPGDEGATLAVETEDRAALIDSLILCKFLRGVFQDPYQEWSHMLNLVTGWDTTASELRDTARRIVAARKLFNIRAGWQPDEDTLPDRFFDDELPEDRSAQLTRAKLSELKTAYHRVRNWQPDGFISTVELLRLGLVQQGGS